MKMEWLLKGGKAFGISLFFLLFNSFAFSQSYRLASMGYLFIAVDDIDNEVNIYDFCKNPAWIAMDEKVNRTLMETYISNISGGYRRTYEAENLNLYGVRFLRVQRLNRGEAFRGYALYEFEDRLNLYRSLLLYPYDGKAFFVIDTTVGNYRYSGPEVGFDYGVEIAKNFFAGIGFSYSLIDGLKDVYTRSRTIYRNISGYGGFAVNMGKGIISGIKFGFTSSQEKLEAKSEDLYDAEVYLSRGEKYWIRRRANVVNLKLRSKGYEGSLQIGFDLDGLKTVLEGGYMFMGERVLIPYGLLEEFEFGYANFRNYIGKFLCRAKLNDFINAGLWGQYRYVDTWSKHSERNLLLWHEKFNFLNLGSGLWIKVSAGLPAFGFEFIYGFSSADSMKYIDNAFIKMEGNDYHFKFGFEYMLSRSIIIRGGANYRFFERDVQTGCENVRYYEINCGFDVSARLGFVVRYGKFQNESCNSLSKGDRKILHLSLLIKLA